MCKLFKLRKLCVLKRYSDIKDWKEESVIDRLYDYIHQLEALEEFYHEHCIGYNGFTDAIVARNLRHYNSTKSTIKELIIKELNKY